MAETDDIPALVARLKDDHLFCSFGQNGLACSDHAHAPLREWCPTCVVHAAADALTRLTRERDEARAEVYDLRDALLRAAAALGDRS
jgi:hypothetical protein